MESMLRLDALGLVDESVTLHMGDVTDANNLTSVIKEVKPDEIYNLAALSHVGVSFDTPASALDINAKGAMNVLEAVRVLDMEERVRIYQASSSEMFGSAPAPQNEDTPFAPCSPYGVAKLSAYWMGRTYRDAYGLHVSNGILFNHESPLRGEDFVTRKIVRAVAAIEAKQQSEFLLGNLDSKRDWGHARDYVQGMWMMLQQDQPDDYVLATGQAHSVREFVERTFAYIGVEIEWRGQGAQEMGVEKGTGRLLVRVDPKLFRPKEVNALLGDAGKAQRILGWRPQMDLNALIKDMIEKERENLWVENNWEGAGA
jgi:GDPmannose 4,6-dehydratase